MKIFSLSIVILSSILLHSCASLLSGSTQEIVIKTQDSVSIKIDSVNLGFNKVFNLEVNKDLIPKQVVISKDGYKTANKVFVQDKYSKLFYVSIFPFALLFADQFEKTPNVLEYKSPYSIDNLRKYFKADSLTKKLFINNVEFAINKENFKLESYHYTDFIKGGNAFYSKSLDSLGVKYSDFDNDLSLVLKKNNFIDTVNFIFIDNVNTYTLNAKVTKLFFYYINKSIDKLSGAAFIETNLTTTWTLTNLYHDTIYTKSIESSSGQFVLNVNKPEITTKSSLTDALENSMLNFIDTIRNQNLIKTEDYVVDFPNIINISKPSKSPTNISEAMNASVTIKNKDGHGSGFFISNDGYILTNHHVIAHSGTYTVVTSDGSEYPAEIIRSNKAIDLALLKINGKSDLAFVIPDKQNYKVGDEVLAIGTPKSVQLGQSVSKGIVSGTRKNRGMNYLQNDIKVNRGNSGGPVVLNNGELTSVVEFKIFGAGVEGLSFSIPAYDIFKTLKISY